MYLYLYSKWHIDFVVAFHAVHFSAVCVVTTEAVYIVFIYETVYKVYMYIGKPIV